MVAQTSLPQLPESPSEDVRFDELSAARQRWAEAGPETYHFTFEDHCGECDPFQSLPRYVAIWDGESSASQRVTVEGMFDRVEKAIRARKSVDVAYDPELGYPTEMALDMEARAYDGGTHWQVRDLTRGLLGEDVSLADLEEARDLWKTTSPSTYEFWVIVHCDCPGEGTIWTLVDEGRVVDWRDEFDSNQAGPSLAITIDEMFEDLARMLSSSSGLTTGGVHITGSAAYHPELGYPEWVGLDVEVLDPESEFAWAAPRLVISVTDVVSVED